jgi:hypothetical protein
MGWIPYNFSGTLDSLAFLDQTIRSEEHNTDLAGFQVHAHALDTGCEPTGVSDARLGGHWMLHTRRVLLLGRWPCRVHGRYRHCLAVSAGFPCKSGDDAGVCRKHPAQGNIPDGQNPTGLSEAGLLLHTADSRLENGGDLGGCWFGVGIISHLSRCAVENGWCCSRLKKLSVSAGFDSFTIDGNPSAGRHWPSPAATREVLEVLQAVMRANGRRLVVDGVGAATYGGHSARGRKGARGAGGLSEGVPEHDGRSMVN